MRRIALFVLLVVLCSGCLGLPTLETTPTTTSTTLPPNAAVRDIVRTIKITGDVYVRDDKDNVVGWLYKEDQLHAECAGNWCKISSGIFSGYQFWRGCSSNNPERNSCLARK